MISDDFLPAATGVGIHLQLVTRTLAAQGHHVCVVTTRRPRQPAFEIWHGVEVHRVYSLRISGFWQALPSKAVLRDILARHGSEIVHFHYLSLLLKRAKVVAAERGLPMVYTYHMTADHLTQPWFMRPFRAWIEREIAAVCNACTLVWAPSARLASELKETLHAPVHFLSNPVAFAEEIQTTDSTAQTKEFTVMYAGRLHPEKNVALLLQAFARLKACRPNVRLVIAGDGSLRKALGHQAQTLGIASHTEFLGHLEHTELAGRYASANVFVLPSIVETQGMVALEAMRFSLPVLVTNQIVSANELVDHGRSGFIVRADVPEDLANRLIELHDQPTLRQHMGMAGRKRALLQSPEIISEQMAAHYAMLCR